MALFLVAPLAASAAPAVPYLPVPRGAAVILNTGSTSHTLGYRVVIQRSGAAEEYINGPKRATAVVPASLTTLISSLMCKLRCRC